MLADEPAHYFDGIVRHLKAKARAMSGDEDDIDWDETFGGGD